MPFPGLFQPSAATLREREQLLRVFPNDQQRNRALFNEWAAAMNSIEQTGLLPNGNGPSTLVMQKLSEAINAIEDGDRKINYILDRLYTIVSNGIRARELPADTLVKMNLQDRGRSGLGIAPLVLLVILGVPAATIAYIVTKQHETDMRFLRDIKADNHKTAISLQTMRSGGIPTRDMLPGSGTPAPRPPLISIDGGGTATAGVLSSVPVLLLAAAGLFMFTRSKGRR